MSLTSLHGRPLSTLLFQLAVAYAAAGCTSNSSGGNCRDDATTLQMSASDACAALATEDVTYLSDTLFGNSACVAACGGGRTVCTFPQSFVDAYKSANAGAAAAADAGDAGATARTCPASAAMPVQCNFDCTGRWTGGAERRAPEGVDLAAYHASAAYMEEVSVMAFARLARELAAYGAPAELVALATRAADEEVAHAEAMWRLAERFGAVRRAAPARVETDGVRPLVAVAIENAVEGCVRETFGAAVGAFRAVRATDPAVRETMRDLARDECGHAELSWRVLAWTLGRLHEAERAVVARAMEDARRDLLEDLARERSPSPADAARLGAPSVAEKRALFRLVEGLVAAA